MVATESLLWSIGERHVRTLYNIADLNTKSLKKDRFMCLLYMSMLNFAWNEEYVGSDENERMQAKEVVNGQVNMMCRVISEKNGERHPCSQISNKAENQVLRILSTFSLSLQRHLSRMLASAPNGIVSWC